MAYLQFCFTLFRSDVISDPLETFFIPSISVPLLPIQTKYRSTSAVDGTLFISQNTGRATKFGVGFCGNCYRFPSDCRPTLYWNQQDLPPSSISISYGEGIVRRESIYSHHLTELMLFLPTFTGLVRTIWGWMGNISSTSLRSCSANSATIHSANPGSEWNDMINNDNPSCCLTTRPTLYLDSLALLGWRWALHASHTVIRPTCWRNVWNVSKYACLVS